MILSLLSINVHTKKITKESYSLSSFNFLARKSVRELIQFTSKEIVGRVTTDEFQECIHKLDNKKVLKFYLKVFEGEGMIMCVDGEYPQHIAYTLLKDAKLGEKDYGALIKEYEDYKSKDILMSVNQELDETKLILSRALEDVLGRGEKLDELIHSAEDLSTQTKQLFEMSKKQNRCSCGFG
jgi:synaptobrevin family protein YKT6